MNRILGGATRAVTKPWQMYPVGLLFGLGFDTATEVSLLVLAGGAAAFALPWYAILTLPILFAAGMSLLDSIDGCFMNFAYGWAFSKPVRKVYYNITITGLSVAVALIIGTDRAGLDRRPTSSASRPGRWPRSAGLNLNDVGYAIVGLFVADLGGGPRGLAVRPDRGEVDRGPRLRSGRRLTGRADDRSVGQDGPVSSARGLLGRAGGSFRRRAGPRPARPLGPAAWADLLTRLIPPIGSRIADLGCGTGSIAVLLAEQGHRVTGLDASPRMIEAAADKAARLGVDLDLRLGDASAPVLAPASYDVVLARHVVWALPDPATSLRAWVDLLVPGGRLVLVEGYWSTGGGLHARRPGAAVGRGRSAGRDAVEPLTVPGCGAARSSTSATRSRHAKSRAVEDKGVRLR